MLTDFGLSCFYYKKTFVSKICEIKWAKQDCFDNRYIENDYLYKKRIISTNIL